MKWVPSERYSRAQDALLEDGTPFGYVMGVMPDMWLAIFPGYPDVPYPSEEAAKHAVILKRAKERFKK